MILWTYCNAYENHGAYYIFPHRNNDHRYMIIGGWCLFPEKNSGYPCPVFDPLGHLVGNYSNHFDITDYHYHIPFDNGYSTDLHFTTVNCLDMTESDVLWLLIY